MTAGNLALRGTRLHTDIEMLADAIAISAFQYRHVKFSKKRLYAGRYQVFYTQFSKNLKLGVYEEETHRVKLAGLLRFSSSMSGGNQVSGALLHAALLPFGCVLCCCHCASRKITPTGMLCFTQAREHLSASALSNARISPFHPRACTRLHARRFLGLYIALARFLEYSSSC
eukprot:6211849-Pleurochrysis_carterae.AAC.9